ncbi:cation-translocating P-type ATPase [Planotetraspora kaengkrachanensis]|uniref:cation-translocating P-type ATPase n=1 Tax=Planotetraspora kaengkrachanensis TaxID=575193 RepID=UPI001EF3B86C|nr:cation-translocating P-type ATPase [Planotetraspora kaengkrachanensis]
MSTTSKIRYPENDMWPFGSLAADSLLALVPDQVLTLVPDPVLSLIPRARRTQVCAGGVRISLRVIGGPGTEKAISGLETRLLDAGMDRAEVNGALGCVFVACDPETVDMDKLLRIVEEFDVDDLDGGPGADPEADREADPAGEDETGDRQPDPTGEPEIDPAARVAQAVQAVLDDAARAEAAHDRALEDREPGEDLADATDEELADGAAVLGGEAADDWEMGDGPEDGADEGIWARDAREQHARAALSLAGSLLGAGVALAGRATRVWRLPPTVPTFLHLAEHTPRVRRELEHRIGAPGTEVLFATTRLVGQTLGQRPAGLFVDSLAAAGRYAEARAGLGAWARLEEGFATHDGAYAHVRAEKEPRPESLPRGPIERYCEIASPASLAAHGLTLAASRSRARALSVLITGTPKSARVGRDAFASAVGRALAKRGGVVLNRHALRRMDRVDTVVLDAETLTTGSWTIDAIVPLTAKLDLDDLHDRLYSLLDLTDPDARRRHDGWKAEPYKGDEDLAQVAQWRAQGVRPVSVIKGRRAVALVGLAPELHPLAEALAEAAGGTCEVLLAGGPSWLARRLHVAQVAGGEDLTGAVLDLQAEGRGVAVVAGGSHRALRQADLGVGLIRKARQVPWEADVLGDLDCAHLMLACLPAARRASELGVRLAAASAVVGGALGILGLERTAVRRAQLVADGTSLASVVLGTWAGRRVGNGGTPVTADRTPWHAMSAQDVLARLNSSPGGLTEAEAMLRRKTSARSAPAGPESLAKASVEELANPLTPVLAAGAGVSAAIGSVLDAVLIVSVMGVNALLGGAQRRDAGRVLSALSEATAVRVRLRRPDGGQSSTAEDLVPGDVIELRAGDAVPADARLLKAVGLEIDESTLTGESQLVSKAVAPTTAPAVADRSSMVYEGSSVAAGSGLAVVVATGEETETGRTANLIHGGPPPSGVELRLRTLSSKIVPMAIGSGVVLMAGELLRGASLSQALAPAVSLAVAAVPEGLPFVATLAELAAAKRLSTRNTLVRNPSTIEALGRVDVLCFDKTGTLTEGHISLRRVSDGRVEGGEGSMTPRLRRVVAAALRAGPKFEGGRVLAHPTDRAVVEGAQGLGVAPDEGLDKWERVDEMPFEPARGFHAVLGLSESGHLLSVKGAPEVVLTRCATLLRDDQEAELDEDARLELETEVERLALQGFRVLAVAERPASSRADLDESRVDRLCFLGFLGMADPVRPTAARSVQGLMKAGVRVIMLTGDHPSTAEAIAAEIDAVNGLRIMTGPSLDVLDDEELVKILPEVSVFARTTPAHKARIVAALRQSGSIVAVTGDGANDVPAIRLADVGVALGSRATAAARAAADIVVTDDRIETIIDAIVEGRAMWGSVRDALGILLGGNIGEIIFTVGSSLLTGRSALNARQLLLVNMLTDMLPAMAVAVRPPSAASPEKVLEEGPESSLGSALTKDINVRAVTTASAAGAAWLAARMTGTRSRADTVALVALVSAQLLRTLGAGGRDRTVTVAAVSSMAALMVIVSTPGVSQFFGSRPIGPFGWGIGLGSAAASSLMGGAVEKTIERMYG